MPTDIFKLSTLTVFKYFLLVLFKVIIVKWKLVQADRLWLQVRAA